MHFLHTKKKILGVNENYFKNYLTVISPTIKSTL